MDNYVKGRCHTIKYDTFLGRCAQPFAGSLPGTIAVVGSSSLRNS